MSSRPIRLGVVGLGAIARSHHLPAIEANPAYHLSATCGKGLPAGGVHHFESIEQMLAQGPEVDAVSICTPPQSHYEVAKAALLQRKHVLLEKPPCTSVLQLMHLQSLAVEQSVTLYQAWHSQHARGVLRAREWLSTRPLSAARVCWKEDVQFWHPGNRWIWQAGGFGVFDPGINALSILTCLLDEPIFALEATLQIPGNLQTPVAASVTLGTASGLHIEVELDFRHRGTQTWNVELQTDAGALRLEAGGSELSVDGRPEVSDKGQLASEYRSIYQQFARLVARAGVEVDARPLQLVHDIFFMAKRVSVDAILEDSA